MDHIILIILSGLVIFSYLFDLFAKKTKIPSVLLLLFLGIGLHYATEYFGIKTFNLKAILPTLGTIGLILIVLEGALELKFERSKLKIIIRAFFAALFILLITTFSIAYLLYYLSDHHPFNICFLDAIPFSIISSAIAIPSVANILKEKREFIIYESSFSDIFGIMLFNFTLGNDNFSANSFLHFGLDTLLVVVVSGISCFILLYILGRLSHNVKFFLIISILIFVYALSKEFHLSSLVIVLAFGIFMANAERINYKWFKRIFIYEKLKSDLIQLHQLSAESAFLLRTFFFIIFGFTINMQSMLEEDVFIYTGYILAVIYAVRFVYLKFFTRSELIPELFITPRGLISILLFYSIPDDKRLPVLAGGVLFQVIIVTTVLMTLGLLRAKSEKPEAAIIGSGEDLSYYDEHSDMNY
ncbi:hypothetical protein BH09BAC5_BH09BAC5_03530 [soil metagenome]